MGAQMWPAAFAVPTRTADPMLPTVVYASSKLGTDVVFVNTVPAQGVSAG